MLKFTRYVYHTNISLPAVAVDISHPLQRKWLFPNASVTTIIKPFTVISYQQISIFHQFPFLLLCLLTIGRKSSILLLHLLSFHLAMCDAHHYFKSLQKLCFSLSHIDLFQSLGVITSITLSIVHFFSLFSVIFSNFIFHTLT